MLDDIGPGLGSHSPNDEVPEAPNTESEEELDSPSTIHNDEKISDAPMSPHQESIEAQGLVCGKEDGDRVCGESHKDKEDSHHEEPAVKEVTRRLEKLFLSSTGSLLLEANGSSLPPFLAGARAKVSGSWPHGGFNFGQGIILQQGQPPGLAEETHEPQEDMLKSKKSILVPGRNYKESPAPKTPHLELELELEVPVLQRMTKLEKPLNDPPIPQLLDPTHDSKSWPLLPSVALAAKPTPTQRELELQKGDLGADTTIVSQQGLQNTGNLGGIENFSISKKLPPLVTNFRKTAGEEYIDSAAATPTEVLADTAMLDVMAEQAAETTDNQLFTDSGPRDPLDPPPGYRDIETRSGMQLHENPHPSGLSLSNVIPKLGHASTQTTAPDLTIECSDCLTALHSRLLRTHERNDKIQSELDDKIQRYHDLRDIMENSYNKVYIEKKIAEKKVEFLTAEIEKLLTDPVHIQKTANQIADLKLTNCQIQMLEGKLKVQEKEIVELKHANRQIDVLEGKFKDAEKSIENLLGRQKESTKARQEKKSEQIKGYERKLKSMKDAIESFKAEKEASENKLAQADIWIEEDKRLLEGKIRIFKKGMKNLKEILKKEVQEKQELLGELSSDFREEATDDKEKMVNQMSKKTLRSGLGGEDGRQGIEQRNLKGMLRNFKEDLKKRLDTDITQLKSERDKLAEKLKAAEKEADEKEETKTLELKDGVLQREEALKMDLQTLPKGIEKTLSSKGSYKELIRPISERVLHICAICRAENPILTEGIPPNANSERPVEVGACAVVSPVIPIEYEERIKDLEWVLDNTVVALENNNLHHLNELEQLRIAYEAASNRQLILLRQLQELSISLPALDPRVQVLEFLQDAQYTLESAVNLQRELVSRHTQEHLKNLDSSAGYQAVVHRWVDFVSQDTPEITRPGRIGERDRDKIQRLEAQCREMEERSIRITKTLNDELRNANAEIQSLRDTSRNELPEMMRENLRRLAHYKECCENSLSNCDRLKACLEANQIPLPSNIHAIDLEYEPEVHKPSSPKPGEDLRKGITKDYEEYIDELYRDCQRNEKLLGEANEKLREQRAVQRALRAEVEELRWLRTHKYRWDKLTSCFDEDTRKYLETHLALSPGQSWGNAEFRDRILRFGRTSKESSMHEGFIYPTIIQTPSRVSALPSITVTDVDSTTTNAVDQQITQELFSPPGIEIGSSLSHGAQEMQVSDPEPRQRRVSDITGDLNLPKTVTPRRPASQPDTGLTPFSAPTPHSGLSYTQFSQPAEVYSSNPEHPQTEIGAVHGTETGLLPMQQPHGASSEVSSDKVLPAPNVSHLASVVTTPNLNYFLNQNPLQFALPPWYLQGMPNFHPYGAPPPTFHPPHPTMFSHVGPGVGPLPLPPLAPVPTDSSELGKKQIEIQHLQQKVKELEAKELTASGQIREQCLEIGQAEIRLTALGELLMDAGKGRQEAIEALRVAELKLKEVLENQSKHICVPSGTGAAGNPSGDLVQMLRDGRNEAERMVEKLSVEQDRLSRKINALLEDKEMQKILIDQQKHTIAEITTRLQAMEREIDETRRKLDDCERGRRENSSRDALKKVFPPETGKNSWTMRSKDLQHRRKIEDPNMREPMDDSTHFQSYNLEFNSNMPLQADDDEISRIIRANQQMKEFLHRPTNAKLDEDDYVLLKEHCLNLLEKKKLGQIEVADFEGLAALMARSWKVPSGDTPDVQPILTKEPISQHQVQMPQVNNKLTGIALTEVGQNLRNYTSGMTGLVEDLTKALTLLRDFLKQNLPGSVVHDDYDSYGVQARQKLVNKMNWASEGILKIINHLNNIIPAESIVPLNSGRPGLSSNFMLSSSHQPVNEKNRASSKAAAIKSEDKDSNHLSVEHSKMLLALSGLAKDRVNSLSSVPTLLFTTVRNLHSIREKVPAPKQFMRHSHDSDFRTFDVGRSKDAMIICDLENLFSKMAARTHANYYSTMLRELIPVAFLRRCWNVCNKDSSLTAAIHDTIVLPLLGLLERKFRELEIVKNWREREVYLLNQAIRDAYLESPRIQGQNVKFYAAMNDMASTRVYSESVPPESNAMNTENNDSAREIKNKGKKEDKIDDFESLQQQLQEAQDPIPAAEHQAIVDNLTEQLQQLVDLINKQSAEIKDFTIMKQTIKKAGQKALEKALKDHQRESKYIGLALQEHMQERDAKSRMLSIAKAEVVQLTKNIIKQQNKWEEIYESLKEGIDQEKERTKKLDRELDDALHLVRELEEQRGRFMEEIELYEQEKQLMSSRCADLEAENSISAIYGSSEGGLEEEGGSGQFAVESTNEDSNRGSLLAQNSDPPWWNAGHSDTTVNLNLCPMPIPVVRVVRRPDSRIDGYQSQISTLERQLADVKYRLKRLLKEVEVMEELNTKRVDMTERDIDNIVAGFLVSQKEAISKGHDPDSWWVPKFKQVTTDSECGTRPVSRTASRTGFDGPRPGLMAEHHEDSNTGIWGVIKGALMGCTLPDTSVLANDREYCDRMLLIRATTGEISDEGESRGAEDYQIETTGLDTTLMAWDSTDVDENCILCGTVWGCEICGNDVDENEAGDDDGRHDDDDDGEERLDGDGERNHFEDGSGSSYSSNSLEEVNENSDYDPPSPSTEPSSWVVDTRGPPPCELQVDDRISGIVAEKTRERRLALQMVICERLHNKGVLEGWVGTDEVHESLVQEKNDREEGEAEVAWKDSAGDVETEWRTGELRGEVLTLEAAFIEEHSTVNRVPYDVRRKRNHRSGGCPNIDVMTQSEDSWEPIKKVQRSRCFQQPDKIRDLEDIVRIGRAEMARQKIMVLGGVVRMDGEQAGCEALDDVEFWHSMADGLEFAHIGAGQAEVAQMWDGESSYGGREDRDRNRG